MTKNMDMGDDMQNRLNFLFAVALIFLTACVIVQSIYIGNLQVELSNFKCITKQYIEKDGEMDDLTIQAFKKMYAMLEER